MSSIKRNKVLYDSALAGTGDWVRLDSRYDSDNTRTVQAYITSGDTVTIEGTTVDFRGKTEQESIALIQSEDIVNIKVFSATGFDTLNGTWTFIRAVKTGTNGTAKVQGLL